MQDDTTQIEPAQSSNGWSIAEKSLEALFVIGMLGAPVSCVSVAVAYNLGATGNVAISAVMLLLFGMPLLLALGFIAALLRGLLFCLKTLLTRNSVVNKN